MNVEGVSGLDRRPSGRMYLIVGLLVASMGLAGFAYMAGPASAAPCGGAIPCSCDDTLTSSRTLTNADPVTLGPCGNGLKIKGDFLTLNCAGRTISGAGSGIGIRVIGENHGVSRCSIQNFGTGIRGGGLGGWSFLDNVIKNVKHGIRARTRGGEDNSSGSVITGNIVLDATSAGIRTGGWFNEVIGDDIVTRNVVNGSRVGFDLKGRAPTMGLNKALNNDTGFKLQGRDATVEGNDATGNRIGFQLKLAARGEDSGSSVSENVAEGNTKAGFQGQIRGADFSTNLSQLNGGDGINLTGGTPAWPNFIGSNVARLNGGNGIVITGLANMDFGGNVGQFNSGSTQCSIGGVACL